MKPGDNWDCRVTCIRYYCWNNELEESPLVGCTPESEEILVPTKLPIAEDTSEYPSYTAMSIKYPNKSVAEKIDDYSPSVSNMIDLQ